MSILLITSSVLRIKHTCCVFQYEPFNVVCKTSLFQSLVFTLVLPGYRKDSNAAAHSVDRFLVSKETVLLRRWERDKNLVLSNELVKVQLPP